MGSADISSGGPQRPGYKYVYQHVSIDNVDSVLNYRCSGVCYIYMGVIGAFIKYGHRSYFL